MDFSSTWILDILMSLNLHSGYCAHIQILSQSPKPAFGHLDIVQLHYQFTAQPLSPSPLLFTVMLFLFYSVDHIVTFTAYSCSIPTTKSAPDPKLHACFSPLHSCPPVLLLHDYAIPIASCSIYSTGQGELSALNLKINFAIAVYLTPVSSFVIV
jgi:hypothetical protein